MQFRRVVSWILINSDIKDNVLQKRQGAVIENVFHEDKREAGGNY